MTNKFYTTCLILCLSFDMVIFLSINSGNSFFFFYFAAGDINAPAPSQTNKTFLPWETHLFTRLLKYGESCQVFLFTD